jgi:hypothetical protein
VELLLPEPLPVEPSLDPDELDPDELVESAAVVLSLEPLSVVVVPVSLVLDPLPLLLDSLVVNVRPPLVTSVLGESLHAPRFASTSEPLRWQHPSLSHV